MQTVQAMDCLALVILVAALVIFVIFLYTRRRLAGLASLATCFISGIPFSCTIPNLFDMHTLAFGAAECEQPVSTETFWTEGLEGCYGFYVVTHYSKLKRPMGYWFAYKINRCSVGSLVTQ